ncbi:hypothetical protein [Jatrophihabitans sp.]|uniref:hypothetical protein n=1 Tax=Jatrophihabitans sp. TaxID=1932789 RepID=UPI0030C68F08|nr:hypothetical protein [Jatrophihabitans sp.]
MGSTATFGWTYPDSDADPDVPRDMKTLADEQDASLAPKFADTGWKTITGLTGGWAGTSLAARCIGNQVFIRGYIVNATFTGLGVTLASLPAGIPAPPVVPHQIDASGNATNSVRSVTVMTDGTIQVSATVMNAAHLYLSTSYLTD